LKQKIRADNYITLRPELAYKKKIVLLVTRNKTSSLLNHTESVGKVLGVDINALADLLKNVDLYLNELYIV
ncbi:MAG: hypothetical protein M1348_03060, partial [Candidatus Parvarchaeota archaeon]|nr:hypothetical protein [Candidatus Parvarchaeota archaeon]